MKKYEISVVINVYINDDPLAFKRAMESIINQSYKPKEIIVVEDGPLTEGHYKVLQELNFINIKYKSIKLEKNAGRGIARGEGVKAAECELIAIMDSDDICMPQRFEKQVNIFESNPLVDVCGGRLDELVNTPDSIESSRIMPQSDNEIKKILKKRNPINHVTVMMKKNKVLQAGNYLPGYIDEDYYLMCRLYLCGAQFFNLSDTLVKANIGNGMINRRGGYDLFKSQLLFNKWMLSKEIISVSRFVMNITERFIVEVLMTPYLRSFFYKKFLRVRK